LKKSKTTLELEQQLQDWKEDVDSPFIGEQKKKLQQLEQEKNKIVLNREKE
jgi:hypothetical protein